MPDQGARPKKGVEGEAQATRRNPTGRGKCGTKRHLLTDGAGVPLAVVISGANRHDMKKLVELLDASLVEHEPDSTPEKHLCLDRGYDYQACREQAQEHGYTAHIPPKATPELPLPAPDGPQRHPPRHGVVEVSHAWFNRFRRLLIRWDKLAANYLGFVQLAASLIIYRKIRQARILYRLALSPTSERREY